MVSGSFAVTARPPAPARPTVTVSRGNATPKRTLARRPGAMLTTCVASVVGTAALPRPAISTLITRGPDSRSGTWNMPCASVITVVPSSKTT